MPLLSVTALTHRFGSTQALAGAELTIDRGEIVALMGANSAGKSTLVKVLSGVLSPDAGAIILNGHAFAPKTPAEAAAAGIATVHQSTDIVGAAGMSVADVLLLNRFADRGTPFFVTRAGLRRQAQAMLALAGFSLSLDRDFGDLSAGDRQLVAIARALADRADLLILDEPTASLSGEESRKLFDVLSRLRDQGLAILYISHRTADLEAITDRALVMRGGRVVGNFRRPIDFSSAIEAMLGRSLQSGQADGHPGHGSAVLDMRGVRLLPLSAPFDLTVYQGEVVAITGVLGAGKSRLLSTIFGLLPLAEGRMLLDGKRHAPKSPAEAIAAGVAMAGEDRRRSSLMPAGWPGSTVAATISLPHLAKWYRRGLLLGNREEMEARRAITRLDIKAHGAFEPVWNLSGGNQQKTVIARWDAEPSRLLLLDEPFQGIDVGARQDIIRSIRSRRDRATLIATSDTEEAFTVADRVLVLDRHALQASADHPSAGPFTQTNPLIQGSDA